MPIRIQLSPRAVRELKLQPSVAATPLSQRVVLLRTATDFTGRPGRLNSPRVRQCFSF
jgi:hypothetical protein